jgi:hypothetical protein
MPASGKKDVMSEAELEQRHQASRKHGAYSFKDNGVRVLDHQGRSRLQEIKEQLETRQGVVDMMQERTANAVMLVELVTSYVAKEHKAGIPLDEIPVFRSLPAFMNSAHRQIKDLLDAMPNDGEVLDLAEHVKRAMGDNGDGHS